MTTETQLVTNGAVNVIAVGWVTGSTSGLQQVAPQQALIVSSWTSA